VKIELKYVTSAEYSGYSDYNTCGQQSQVDIVQLSSRNIETCHNNFHSLVVRPGHDGCTESNEAAPALSYFIGFIV